MRLFHHLLAVDDIEALLGVHYATALEVVYL